MREATGGALIINIILTFIIIFLALLATSVNYSKAFKVNNRIVNLIEKNGSYNDKTKTAIDTYLKNVGYVVTSSRNTCQSDIGRFVPNVNRATSIYRDVGYKYCVYQVDDCVSQSTSERNCKVYYKVVTYMYFDIPIINEVVKIPVTGETRSFVK